VRILYVVSAFPREPGDIITPWLLETIRRLGSAGIEVEVLAPAYRGLRSQVVEGIRVHRFRYAPRSWETITHDQTAPDRIRERPVFFGLVPSYVASGAASAARLTRTGRFDVVHAFWPVPHSVLGLAAKYAGGIPLVSTFFGVEVTWVRSQLPLLRPVLRALVRRSDAVTAISSYTAAALRDLVPSADPVLIPFGATVEVVEQTPPRPAATGRPFTVLFVGRLVERKGVSVLLDAIQRLRPQRDVRLEIVGDGPLRHGLERHAAELDLGEAVRFRGLVDDEQLARRYVECDAFVLPAVIDSKGDTEGLGVVLLEALAHGRPVIASAVGGITDIVRDSETGLLVPAGEADALAAAIQRLVDSPALAQELANRGQRHVIENFSWTGITRRLVSLYTEVATSGRS